MQARAAVSALVLAGIALAGCGASSTPTTTTSSTTTTTLAPPLGRGQQAPGSAIPFAQVGPGWLLATWNQNKPIGPGEKVPPGNLESPPTSLFLVNPVGGRYLVVANPNANYYLAAWSGDARRALMVSVGANPVLRQVSLSTGATLSSFTFKESNSVLFTSARFTRPNGYALIVVAQVNGHDVPYRYSTTGVLQQRYPSNFSSLGRFDGSVLSSPDGTQLVLGAERGVAVVANDGTLVSQLPVPGTAGFCQAMRWWATNVVLASCMGSNGSARLYKVPTDGSAVTALTAVPVRPDYGDMNAWKLLSGTYVLAAGGCGSTYVAKLLPSSRTAPITVPGVAPGSSVWIDGATDEQLALQATVSCGNGESALWFNPATNVSTVVLGPPLQGGGVTSVLSYPVPQG